MHRPTVVRPTDYATKVTQSISCVSIAKTFHMRLIDIVTSQGWSCLGEIWYVDTLYMYTGTHAEFGQTARTKSAN